MWHQAVNPACCGLALVSRLCRLAYTVLSVISQPQGNLWLSM